VALPGFGDEKGGIHPVVAEYFHKYQQAYGQPPGRNAIQTALASSGISRAAVRRSWHLLKQADTTDDTESASSADTQGDSDMPDSSTLSSPIADLTTQVEQLTAQNVDLRTQLVLTRDQLGKATARLASHERTLTELEGRVQGLIERVRSHDADVVIVREFRDLVTKDDEAWDALMQMVRAASVTSKLKPLLRWCARLTGRALGRNDLLQP
jgi:chromosome condensin MukBEF ATPase and DNA-binding subunit MukB